MNNKRNVYSYLIVIVAIMFVVSIMYYFLNNSYALSSNWYEDYTYQLDDTLNTITLSKYNGSDSIIVVPSSATIGSKTYQVIISGTTSSNTLYAGNKNITKITFENGVKAGTSLRNLFYGCSNLKTIIFNNFDTSNTTTMRYMLHSCTSLKELDLSSLSTESITGSYSMYDFIHAVSLNKIKLGKNFDFHVDNISRGTTFGRGLWRKQEDGLLYSAVSLALDSSTKDVSGTYIKESSIIDEMKINYPVTYKIGNISSIDSFSTTNSMFYQSENKIIIKVPVPTSTDDYQVPGKVELLFENIVSDELDNKYNLKVTIDNVHLYDLDNSAGVDKLYAYIASFDEGMSLRSYFYSDENLSNTIYKDSAIKQDVTLQIVDSNGNAMNGNFIFSAYDLDIPSKRDGVSQGLANHGYGMYSEGINLISGYDTTYNTLKMYPRTFLILDNNRIYGTNYDEESELSEFSISVDASMFKFAWSGEECYTYILSYYQPRIVEIVKQDENGNNISGADLQLYLNDNLLNSWTTTNESKKIFLTNASYTLKETRTPNGYTKADDLTFYVDIGNQLNVNGENVEKIIMKDDFNTYPYTVNYYDKDTNAVIHDIKVENNVKYKTVISSLDEVINISNYLFDSSDKEQLTIGTNSNVINLYYTRIKGQIVEKHIDKYNNVILYENEYNLPTGESYDIKSKSFDGYILIENELPDNSVGIVSETKQEIIYYYQKQFIIDVRVDGVGGEVYGNEHVIEGNDSTPDYITINADEGYFISKITINGEEIDITDSKAMVLPNFIDLQENKEIVVNFELEKIADVPKTSANGFSLIISLVLLIIGLTLVFLNRRKKKVLIPE